MSGLNGSDMDTQVIAEEQSMYPHEFLHWFVDRTAGDKNLAELRSVINLINKINAISSFIRGIELDARAGDVLDCYMQQWRLEVEPVAGRA